MIEIDHQPRVDTLVTDAANGEPRRRTEYLGSAWFNGRVEVAGAQLRRIGPPGVTVPGLEVAFFVPDSLPYARAALADAQLSLEMSVRASGEAAAIAHADAAFVDDPSGAPAWVQIQLDGYGVWPFAVSYRVVALTPTDAIVS